MVVAKTPQHDVRTSSRVRPVRKAGEQEGEDGTNRLALSYFCGSAFTSAAVSLLFA